MMLKQFFGFCFIAVSTTSLFAGEYVLESGQDQAVCSAYLNNLNRATPSLPYTCARPANSSLGIDSPAWHRLLGSSRIPVGVNIPLSVNKYLWRRDANPVYYVPISEWPYWQGTPKQTRQAWNGFEAQRNALLGMGGPKYAEIDIDNDGKSEPVYFEDGCGSTFGSILIVLQNDFSGIDLEKTKLVMPHPSRKEAGWNEFRKPWPAEIKPELMDKLNRIRTSDSLHSAYYNVFSFNSKYYFDSWWKTHPDYKGKHDFLVGKLRVFQATGNKTREVCRYKFDLSI